MAYAETGTAPPNFFGLEYTPSSMYSILPPKSPWNVPGPVLILPGLAGLKASLSGYKMR